MHLDYDLENSDYLSYYQQILMSDKTLKKSRVKMAMWGVVIPLMLLIIFRLNIWWWIAGCIFAIVWIFVISRMMFSDMFDKVIKDKLAKSNNKKHICIDFQEDNLLFDNENIEISNYYVLLDMIAINLKDEEILIIPQRELEKSPELLKKLIMFLENKKAKLVN